jgi:hypothetical protein
MRPSVDAMERHIQLTGALLIIGLLVEAACLLWARPITFVIFVVVGGFFLLAGVTVFLFSLVSAPHVRD